ncbi:MAG: DUF255 domain-containing protein [Bacteroidetes bacterium]|nr:MAG: DUF255 domain-containing protein [Bacteroidota bacterium]
MKKILIGLFAVGMIGSAFVWQESTDEKTGNEISVPADSEIVFQDLSFEKALKKAKETGKLVFIDSYTSWCGPCKRMAATAFKDASVAKLFNSKFINLKIEMEKSADGPVVARKYGVRAYPTLLFVDGDGKLVKSVIGSQTAAQLLGVGKSL